MAINTHLDNLIGILPKGSDSPHGDGDDGTERPVFFIEGDWRKALKMFKALMRALEANSGLPMRKRRPAELPILARPD